MKTLLTILGSVLLLAVAVSADEMSDAQKRIRDRQGEVAALKEKGAVGENNRGYLEVRAAAAGAAQAVEAENHDRGILYGVVAQRSGGTADAAGRERAKEIARNSKPGVWVQDESGAWKKK